jgi:predicted Zn-dependent peptidase
MSASLSYVADRAIARRLFVDYPYGQPIIGTPETLARIDGADLMLARERFHNPDNATLVVIGGVQETRALRALRQLLGAWRKSDKVAPSTFRLPENPDPRTLIIDMPGQEVAEARIATRALPRADRDQLVATLLAPLVRDRWQAALAAQDHNSLNVRNESFLLSGMFVLGATVRTKETAKVLESARNILRSFVDSPPTTTELDKVRNERLLLLSKGLDEPATIASMWLDAETYKLPSIADQMRALKKITPADVQRVAVRLFRDALYTSVVVGNSALVKPELERSVKVEIPGANRESQPAAPATPSKSP